jgi:hypothetical protein
MNLFKGTFYLVEADAAVEPLSHGFEPEFGNAAATRLWLQAASNLDAVDPAVKAAATERAAASEEAELDCTG